MGNYVLDLDFCFDQQWGPIDLLTDYDVSTDTVMQIQGLNQKVVLVKNPGSQATTFTILGSIDRGAEWDYTELGDTTVGAQGSQSHTFTNYYTHIKVRAKGAQGAQAKIKAAGQSV